MVETVGLPKFTSSDGSHVQGIHQLWAREESVQHDVLVQAMALFDSTRAYNLHKLGYESVRPDDLVRNRSRFYGSRMSDKDILTSLLMNNLDVYPLTGIHRRNLQPDGLDCSIWDNEFGPGYYYHQRESGLLGIINPESADDILRLWEGPKPIPRIEEFRIKNPNINLRTVDHDSSVGCFVLQPGLAYLNGYWPAIKLEGMNVSLKTRSNWGRLALAGAVNSDTVHQGWNGVLTAETTTFMNAPMAIYTSRFPFQMIFDLVNESLIQTNGSRFGSARTVSLEQAARDFQNNPERMLPSLKANSNIKIIQ